MSRESSILAPLQNQLVLSLGSARAFRIAPPISDRQVWQRLGDTGVSIVASAEDFLAHPIPALSLGDYLEDRFHSKYLKVLCTIVSVLMTMVFLAMQ